MCCSECLARSGMATRQGKDEEDRSTAVPRALRDIVAPMKLVESGCRDAVLWMPVLSSLSPTGTTLNA